MRVLKDLLVEGSLLIGGYQAAIKQLFATIGDVVMYSADTERSSSAAISKQFKVEYAGNYRVTYDAKYSGNNGATVTVNGGSSYTCTTSYGTRTIDLTNLAVGATITITATPGSQSTAFLKNARVKHSGTLTQTNPNTTTYGTLTD